MHCGITTAVLRSSVRVQVAKVRVIVDVALRVEGRGVMVRMLVAAGLVMVRGLARVQVRGWV